MALAAGAIACGEDKGGGGPKDEDKPDPFEECRSEDGVVDCSNPLCDAAPECNLECAAQVPTCEAAITGSIDRICVDGSCQAAGPRDEEGALVRGCLNVGHTFDRNVHVPNLRSYVLSVHHGIRPDGKKLSCEDLLGASDADDPSLSNVLARSVENVKAENGDIVKVPINRVPLHEKGRTLLVLTRFFNSTKNPETNAPRGNVAAKSCFGDVEVVEGLTDITGCPDDGAHTYDVEVSPGCNVINDTCTDGKQCIQAAGICRYVCEERCGAAGVCRPLSAGQPPECLRKCNPENPDTTPCDPGFRCDVTAGEDPACMPF